MKRLQKIDQYGFEQFIKGINIPEDLVGKLVHDRTKYHGCQWKLEGGSGQIAFLVTPKGNIKSKADINDLYPTINTRKQIINNYKNRFTDSEKQSKTIERFGLFLSGY